MVQPYNLSGRTSSATSLISLKLKNDCLYLKKKKNHLNSKICDVMRLSPPLRAPLLQTGLTVLMENEFNKLINGKRVNSFWQAY